MTTQNTTLTLAPAGADRSLILMGQLSDIVRKNWKVIYLGADRLGYSIDSDYYAPQRVQIGETRLHKNQGVKYAEGWKYDELTGPNDEKIAATIAAIQRLIDAGSCEVGTQLVLTTK